jgi:Tfp pilus assembly protein PilF
MPVTYNGIGTHYYGKRNLQKRHGQCRSCGRVVDLASYDTRLWFVIVFIPIIPLGRKRILDDCPSCRRHYASDLDKWETARQLEVSGAMEKYRSNPTPEGAIAAHQQLVGFHQVAEAEEFQKTMLAQFPANAKIFAYLGAVQEHLGQHTQAADFFNRALALRPDSPEAAVGVARGHIRAGRLGEARQLLGFLEKPGAAQLYSLEPLETLARACQSAGSHREALELFAKILEALPKAGEHANFRKLVKTSEKALGQTTTILPKLKFSLKRAFAEANAGGARLASARSLMALGVILALVLLGFVVANEYIRRHRTLYLVNAGDAPATVEIPGAATVKNFKGLRTITLPEGHFHAAIHGPVEQALDFELRDSYFRRWFSHPLWLINVGGAALIQETIATYSQNPVPPELAFHTGQTFEQFRNVTHPFTPLPDSVQVESGGTRTLVGLKLFDGEPAGVFNYYRKRRGTSEALTFAETWLRAHPQDETMMAHYTVTAQHQKQGERLDAFLRAGLTNRPVRVEWHRTYQLLHDRPAERPALLRQYDGLLQAEPASSALLYLRGRLEIDRTAARDYFTRASQADPQNKYPLFALAYDRMAAGEWSEASSFLIRAEKLNPRDLSLIHFLFITRLALGEAPALAEEWRQKLARDPLNLLVASERIDALAAANQPDAAWSASVDFANQCRTQYGKDANKWINAVQCHAAYVIGDFKKVESIARNDTTVEGRLSLATAWIEQGRVGEAAKILPAEMDDENKIVFDFALAVACRQNGDEAEAARWQSKAVELLQQGNGDSAYAAALLARGTAPTRAEAENFTFAPSLKAVMLAALSQQYPQARAELAGLARKLNVEPTFPYHLIRRATATPQ